MKLQASKHREALRHTLNVVLDHCRDFICRLGQLKSSVFGSGSPQVGSVVFQDLIAHTKTNAIGNRVLLNAVDEDAVSIAAQQTHTQVWVLSVKRSEIRNEELRNRSIVVYLVSM